MGKPLSLWLGMYLITVVLFWFETGSVATGLYMGLISASLKTMWSVVHGRISGEKIRPCSGCVAREESAL